MCTGSRKPTVFGGIRASRSKRHPPPEARRILHYRLHNWLSVKHLANALTVLLREARHACVAWSLQALKSVAAHGSVVQVCASGRGVGSHVAICVCLSASHHARRPAEKTATTKPARATGVDGVEFRR